MTDYGGYRAHYQGFGVNTPGGRGGNVIKVTNLANSGVGSLRNALEASGSRFIVFEISGYIALTSPIFVTNPFVTIAGQTAPSPGITVRNFAIYFDTHDVVIQHMRFRRGDTNPVSEDALYIRNDAWNIVLDHCSISWGTHGLLDINAWAGAQPHDIAVLDTIMSEGLKKPSPDPAANVPFGTGTLIYAGQNSTATVARNLFAHQGNRNPWFSSGNKVSGYNNVSYDAAGVVNDEGLLGFLQLIGSGYPDWPFDIVWISNIAIPGKDTHPDTHSIKVSITPSQAALKYKLYLEGNLGPFQTVVSQWTGITYQNAATEAAIRNDVIPDWHKTFNYQIMSNLDALNNLLIYVGARPLDRDDVDKRIINDVINKTGQAVSTPPSWSPLVVNNKSYLTPGNPNAIAPGQTFRTNIEMNLEAFAQSLEVKPIPISECPSGYSMQELFVADGRSLSYKTIRVCVKDS